MEKCRAGANKRPAGQILLLVAALWAFVGVFVFVRVAVDCVGIATANICQCKIRLNKEQREDDIAYTAGQPYRNKQYNKHSRYHRYRDFAAGVHKDMSR